MNLYAKFSSMIDFWNNAELGDNNCGKMCPFTGQILSQWIRALFNAIIVHVVKCQLQSRRFFLPHFSIDVRESVGFASRCWVFFPLGDSRKFSTSWLAILWKIIVQQQRMYLACRVRKKWMIKMANHCTIHERESIWSCLPPLLEVNPALHDADKNEQDLDKNWIDKN